MKSDAAILTLALALSATSAVAEGGVFMSKQESLYCAKAEMVVESDCQLTTDTSRQCKRQTLTLHPEASREALPLPHDGRLVKKKMLGNTAVLDGFVTGWSCLKAKDGKQYFLLAYTCSFGEERGACAGESKEWTRLFAPDGRPLSAGLKRQDKRYDALYRKLGLTAVMEAGVTLQGLNF
ncbi:hypothetical protein [Parachitinimonas caeni]|uniref:Uncharacterized protein n=1 Tax=Parachitinimonas caeni TaxID=3031301 RepID=A0ABT7E1E2_9NEIS|nr:hypothetical protein [Parachitinimonas caeni]MDK2126135.1 hypothetical protein [Parachitinimonas caeni]